MLGIPGLDPFGLAHAIIGLAALLAGLLVLLRPKGSAFHRLRGAGYVVAMVLLNASGLAMYGLNGRFNLFHVFALVSLATLAAGWVPALLRRPAQRWHERHAMYMAWSYVGLVGAFASELVSLIARATGQRLDLAIALAGTVVIGLGALAIRRLVPPIVSRMVHVK